jgi:DNA polymerase
MPGIVEAWYSSSYIAASYNASVQSSVKDSYAALVAARKSCRSCPELLNPAACDGGTYDSNQIGPWTLWQGNLNADLVIVGQDWGDKRYFVANKGHDEPHNPTSDTLRRLLATIGIDIPPPSVCDSGGGTVFMTNAILCLKEGGMQARVRPEWSANCGARFLRPTIDLIAPKVVVTLGEQAYKAVSAVYGLPHVAFRTAVGLPEGFILPTGARYLPMYHCGARILNTHRPLEQQVRDWERVKQALGNCS